MNYTEFMDTPIGVLIIKANETGVSHVGFTDCADGETRESAITTRCKLQLDEYFNGLRQVFDLPLDPHGTDFQKSIWNCLITIPFGTAVSYREIADRVNNRKAVRAVGGANGKNPIPIIVPCHRVIGADRSLTGFGGGLERKAWLLNHEGIQFKDGQRDDLKIFQADLFASI